MSTNVLITGAAGFIGGSLIADILDRQKEFSKPLRIFAAVRSQEQVDSLSKLAINVLQLNLTDKAAVENAVINHEIDIIVHTAGAVDPGMVSNLIDALGVRRKSSGQKACYVHSSVLTMFSEEGGWPYGQVKDTDDILEKEKAIEDFNPVRKTNIMVAEKGKELAVTTFNIAVPMTYGRGRGKWRKLSVNIPAFVRTSMKLGAAHKFDKDSSPPTMHVSDLTSLYVKLLESILNEASIPSGDTGYYFAMAHRVRWWKTMEILADRLHSRGLIKEPTVKVWPSYDMAAETLGFPRQHIRAIGTSNGDMVPVNAYKLGWKPTWDEPKFLESLDDEITAVQELDTVKMSLFDSL